MQKRKQYIGKGNTELDPALNPSDQILYEFDDAQKHIYSSIKTDFNEAFAQNILLGGARGCGKSSLVNLAIDLKRNLVVKIDCSIADEEADLLILMVNKLKKLLDSNAIPADDTSYEEIDRLIREITFDSTDICKMTALESIQEDSEGIVDFVAEVCLPLKMINFKSSVQGRLKEVLISKKDKKQEYLQQRVTAYFERKAAFELLIDKINEKSRKKLIFVFDEIDKHHADFLDKVFDKYKSFLTSGKSTNIFLVNISQYYHIMCGNACDNIEVYFDKKYFLRSASFPLFREISYNRFRSNFALETNYYLNRGIFRNIYADMEMGSKDIFLLFKAKYYLELVEFVNACAELCDFEREILVAVLNKVLKRGFIGNRLNLDNLKHICSEEFTAFRNIQLQELVPYILKSHAANAPDWIVLNENEITMDYDIFKAEYDKDLFNSSDHENSSDYWQYYRKETAAAENRDLCSNNRKFEDLNNGQIILGTDSDFGFLLIDDSNTSHEDIIKTLLYSSYINAFIRVKKKNSLGYECGYVFFIDSSTKGKYVLYYNNASWLYEDFWVKEKIDNFISANGIKEIEIEVDSDFEANKDNLRLIIDKYNRHEDIPNDWINCKW